jgi:hypothetical protein
MNQSVTNAVRQASPWVERLARLGFAAKGVVYLLIGVLAARAGLGKGGRATGSRGALRTIAEQPFGKAMLIIIAAGLFGYAVWRIIEAIHDPRGRGSDAKGVALRLGSACKALAYAALGMQAVRLVMGNSSGAGDDQAPRHWTAVALQKPFGHFLVMAAGLGLIGYGIYQCFNAWRAKLNRDLVLSGIAPEMRRWIVGISRFGIGARGVVFVIIGGLLIRAGLDRASSEAEGIAGALRTMAGKPFGMYALTIVGIGLAAYGLYQFINSRYRSIAVE